jgi:ADP-ribose pyrophosphatase YjhB (NUDIX family)
VILVREGELLLVRHTYQDAWYLVGGRVERGETLEEAIRREAAEEVGAALAEVSLFGVYSNFYEGKSDHIVVFECSAFSFTGERDREIESYAFCALERLPRRTSPGTRRRVLEYVEGRGPYVGRW